jgi:DsbC/DsbD-like thiol-disulfide interchange protein
MRSMNRRYALLNLAVLPYFPKFAAAAVPRPYRVSLVSGGTVDGLWQAGIVIEMEPGWKTYWRIPGDAGIPPQFDWTGSENIDSVDVQLPIPTRFHDASGDGIGYHDKVLFPLLIKPKISSQKSLAKLDIFFAVCNSVCIPAKARLNLLLEVSNSNTLLETWQKRVPVIGSIVSSARTENHEAKPMLALKLSQPVDDIFVEANSQIYFGKPRFDIVAGEAWLPLTNINNVTSLKNMPLKLTLTNGNMGIEQTVIVN